MVIVGGGFGGLLCAMGLRSSPVRVTLVDKRNHHLFQPLLYQVATAALSPAQIATPIRRVLSAQANAKVLLGEAQRVDTTRRVLVLRDGLEIPFDYLVLAAGATHSYFGHEEWSEAAPGLKTIEDAVEIRKRFLLAFERAERQTDEQLRRADLTFVVIGAGPTGVEMAGAMIEIARKAIPRDFRSIDTTTARVVLVEAQDRVLPTGFAPELCARAERDLSGLGVEVRTSTRVVEVDDRGVEIEKVGHGEGRGRERIEARNVVWAAGVQASPLGATLGAPLDRAGRVMVGPDLSIASDPRIFVIGDMGKVRDTSRDRDVPGVSPAAMQMGRFVARVIGAEVKRPGTPRPAFRYVDKGTMATIGRARAVAMIGRARFGGFPAWALWALVHVFFLISFRMRVLVMMEWAWAYLVFERGARLITGEERDRGRR